MCEIDSRPGNSDAYPCLPAWLGFDTTKILIKKILIEYNNNYNKIIVLFMEYIGSQTIARNPTSPVIIWNLQQLHQLRLTGKGTTIAILDGGFDHNHFSLQKGDSIKGYNFVPGMDSLVNPNEWSGSTAGNYHGTAVAAIAAGLPFTDGHILLHFPGGVAPDANLYICRVLEPPTCNIHDGLKHIRDVAKIYGIDIVCMSFKMLGKDEQIEALLAELYKLGVVCVAAAGNDGDFQTSVSFPASDPNVLCVGALRPRGQPSDLNPRDVAGIDVYAPGEDIFVPGLSTQSNGDINDGTSLSAPMVAGFLSILIQCANFTQNPRIIAKYHDVKFLKQLFNNYRLCKDRKLLHVFDFLNNIYYGKEQLDQLIQEVYPNFSC